MTKPTCPRFSEHFGINKTQHDLDFVDILPETDLPLYLDPYAFKVGSSTTAIECNNLVVDYFDTVLQCIRDGKHVRGRGLLDSLGEPNETRFGLSIAKAQGRGVGRQQASTVYDKLADSKAVKTGMLRDLSDCELLTPGISQDKISDITTNIVRGRLATFTLRQCRKHGVPTKRVERGVAWSEEHHDWANAYAELLLFENKPLILVPKWMARRQIAANHQEYYRDFVLDYLQQEHLRSGSGLIKVLKSGKRRVTKVSLSEMYPCGKDFLRKFSEEHPDIFKKYRAYLSGKLPEINSSELEKLIRAFQAEHGGPPILVAGDLIVGDKIKVGGNVSGGVVGSGTINARDITKYSETVNKSTLEPDLKKALVPARQAVEMSGLNQTDKTDVSDDLGRITQELEKENPEPGFIRGHTG